jgi:MFS family permease
MRLSGGDIYAVFIYRGFTFFFSAVAMIYLAIFSHKIDSIKAIWLSGIVYILMFATLFILLDALDMWVMYLLGALGGFAGGLYWSGNSVLLTSYTTRANRSVAIGVAGMIQGALTLITPLVSGFAINNLPGMTGYRVMFGVAVVVIIFQFNFTRKLLPIPRQPYRPNSLRFAARLVIKKLTLRMMLGIEFIRGFRDGALLFFLNILLFEIVQSESLVGVNAFLTGALAITGNWVYGRIFTPRRGPLIAAGATSLMIAFGSLLLFFLNTSTIIFFTMVNAFCAVFLINSISNNTLNIFAENKTVRNHMVELVSFRESVIQFGRITGLLVVALFPKNQNGYVLAILTLTAAQYIAVLLLFLTRRVQERKERKVEA